MSEETKIEGELITRDQQEQMIVEIIAKVKAETFGLSLTERFTQRDALSNSAALPALGQMQKQIKANLGYIKFLEEILITEYRKVEKA